MNKLYDLLLVYKDITIKMIICLEKDAFDDLDELFDKRQSVIEEIKSISYTQEEFKALEDTIKINEFQDKMNILMNEKMNSLRGELKKAQVTRSVNRNYTSGGYVDSIYFNKKI